MGCLSAFKNAYMTQGGTSSSATALVHITMTSPHRSGQLLIPQVLDATCLRTHGMIFLLKKLVPVLTASCFILIAHDTMVVS